MLNAASVRTPAQAKKIVEERKLTHVKVGIIDIDGVLRSKYMAKAKFISALEKGFGFCDVVFGWDSNDQLYENVNTTFTGWHTAFPDATAYIVPETCRDIPFEDNMLFFLAEFHGRAEPVCPRSTLKRIVARAKKMGFSVEAAFEYEFFMFDETPESVREKGFRNLQNMTPGFYGYSGIRNSVWSELYHEILNSFEAMRIPIEGLHTETGPGVLEAAIVHDEVVESADRAALFKTFMKVLAQRRGLMATFMAKWSNDWPGQSGHLHMSMTDKAGKPVFHDAKDKHGMSKTMRHFLAGQQALMPELLVMTASTVNSFSRMVPGFWAPTHATWGVENRTCALRVIGGSPYAQRIEYRIAAADANPYLAAAAALGSGLIGIEQKMEPSDPIVGNSYAMKHPAKYSLPTTLMEAADRLRKSKIARDLFGDVFVDHFASSREWEEREFRKHVTDWEMARYFEII